MAFYISVFRNPEGLYMIDFGSRVITSGIQYDSKKNLYVILLNVVLFLIALDNIRTNRYNEKMLERRRVRLLRTKLQKKADANG